MIRVGLLVNHNTVPKWVHDVITRINELDGIQIALVIEKCADGPTKRTPVRVRNFVFIIHYKLDRFFFGNPKALDQLPFPKLKGAKHIKVPVEETLFKDKIPNESVDIIKNEGLDIILRFGFRILVGSILNAAKFGVWSFHHGDNLVNRGGPPGIWEVIERNGETGVTLQILSDSLDGGRVITREGFRSHSYSFSKNQENIYLGSIDILINCILKFRDGKLNLDGGALPPRFYTNKLYKTPTNSQMFVWYLSFSKLALKKILAKVRLSKKWFIAVGANTNSSPNSNLFSYRIIESPRDKYWADPFVVKKNGRNVLFFEEYLCQGGKGRIVCGILEDDRRITETSIVLEEDYHLSYPFIIEADNRTFMIPESSEARCINLYECTNFPTSWVFCSTILNNINAVDTTIFIEDDVTWLFTYEKNSFGSGRLRIFYSSHILDGNWIEHKKSPFGNSLVGRPAGALFKHKEKLYRPVMNNTLEYGNSIVIRKIIKLTKHEFEEIDCDKIEGNWHKNISGVHTLNFNEDFTVIDVLRS